MQRPTPAQLNQQFDSRLWPVFTAVVTNVQAVQFDLIVDAKLSYFAGHFPGQAVLPGVVQVHWAGELARRFFACDGFSNLKRVKFNSVILPAAAVRLSLDYKPQTGLLKFSYFNEDERFSVGTITFRGTT